MSVWHIVGLLVLACVVYWTWSWFFWKGPKEGSQELAMAVWGSFGPYADADSAASIFREVCVTVFGTEGVGPQEKWMAGHIQNFHDIEGKGDFEATLQKLLAPLALTARGPAFQKTRLAVAEQGLAAHTEDPEFLGDFLAYQIVSERFDLNTEELTSVLPEDIRDAAQAWLLFYVAWTFQLAVSEQHGTDFRDRMMQAAKSRLVRADQAKEGFGDELVAAIDGWFSMLDNATESIGTKFKGVEVPFPVFAAMGFLVTDAGSPYYQQTSLPNLIEFNVGEVLASSIEQKKEYIQRVAGVRLG